MLENRAIKMTIKQKRVKFHENLLKRELINPLNLHKDSS